MEIVIFDLDDTLVITEKLKPLRDQRRWSEIKYYLQETFIFPKMLKWYNTFFKRNYKIVVVTNSPKSYARQVLNYHNLKYDLIIGYHDTIKHKPNCDPYKKALEYFNNYEKIIIIGNELKDMLAATDLKNKYNIESQNYLFNCNKDDLLKYKDLIEKNNYVIL